ncbi:probable glucan endo-1,3-beta-glucosidase A6 [Cryptomeria japonica]|nr:probable glucan endo-1,3-beta-glucosidase A6 [Cryptomeria japonica]
MGAYGFHLSLIVACFGIKSVWGDTDPFLLSHAVGINYGRLADNLPPPSKAVELMKSINAGYVEIYDANPEVLKALANSSLPEVPGMASSTTTSDQWLRTNLLPYYPLTKISIIMVGNEILSNTQLQPYLVPAMQNMHTSLQKLNLDSSVKVTTSVAMDALSSSYPPSNGSFRPELAMSVIQPMLSFLSATDSYFFLDVYPFFAWNSDPANISLDYVLFGEITADVVQDGILSYSIMLDAQLDAAIAAMATLGYGEVKVVISETGWPTNGDSSGATVANAASYNTRLVSKFLSNSGSPRRPQTFFPTFIFALFNEGQKPGATIERNWGLFYADGTPVYDIDLSAGVIKTLEAWHRRRRLFLVNLFGRSFCAQPICFYYLFF